MCSLLVVIGIPIGHTLKGMVGAWFSPIKDVPAPEGGGFFLGHLGEIRKADAGDWHEEMIERYGHVLRYKHFFGSDRLFTIDPKAINHILTNAFIYKKPDQMRYTLGSFLGQGLLFSEGAQHKKQRRIMNPSFSLGHIREMTEIFVAKSNELRDVLLSQLHSHDSTARVDMLSLLSSTTLDIIGLAGFNYEFNALKNESTELSLAFHSILRTTNGFPIFQVLKEQFPFLRPFLRFDGLSKNLNFAQTTMQAVGLELIAQKKREIAAEIESGKKSGAKDLLSLLLMSNLDEKGEKLTDHEVLHQIPTFLLAGHETTSTSTTWGLFSLAIHKPIQDRLRQELRTISTDFPSMEELNSLPYLDAVVREILRYHSVVLGTVRAATEDDVIPLETEFIDRHGKTRNSINVRKGDSIFISIVVVNKSRSIWGEDAKEFNPDRWLSPPKATYSIPGVWGNQLTFLGGPRGCIGFKFAVTEMKALLFALIRNLEFDLAVPEEEIFKRSSIVTRPGVKSEMDKGNQMPLIIRVAS
ncbi:cytochrome P450 [Serendipita vermifera]|nr:cytochrome P450 [Serendipita vermifera]